MSLRHLGSNLLLLTVSAAVALILLELGLRLLVGADQLVPNTPSNPALNGKRNELRFYERNRDRPPGSLGRHDPWLGWDSSYRGSRIRGHDEAPPKTGQRAVAVGDSFVFGNEVAEDENFAALLDRAENGLEVLNLGVPGYGLDQSWLKYERYGAPLHPEIVLFGIYVADYERATVAFTAGAKPLFVAGDGEVQLTNQPVPSPAESMLRIAGELENRSWALDFIRYRVAAFPDTTAAFFAAGDRIAAHVLNELTAALTPEQRLLIVHIPRGESFTEPDAFDTAMNDHLLALYEARAVAHVDLGDVFLAHAPADEVAARYYVRRPSGSVGHLNPEGHRQAATAIAGALGVAYP